MITAIVHLSDFHSVEGKAESHAVVVNAFFEDLPRQLANVGADQSYLVFSGDIAQSADEAEQYEEFKRAFDSRLAAVGIAKSQRILVPGNHDVSRKKIGGQLVLHEGVVSQRFSEEAFNDFVLDAPNVLTNKFENYLAFQSSFTELGLAADTVTGRGWDLTGSVGVYCLNTAISSSGGLATKEGAQLRDLRRLRIDTRSLHAWVQSSKAQWKVLVMHHPLHWLEPSTEAELKVILRKHFALRLFGHEHEQDSLHSLNSGSSLLECCAPALFSRKQEKLGYSIVTIDENLGVRDLIYRQWTKNHSFVSGVDFANNDAGKVVLHVDLLQRRRPAIVGGEDAVLKLLKARLDDSLVSFFGQPRVWVDPVIKSTPEVEKDEKSSDPIDLTSLITNPVPTLVKALPQFGLTCLAHYLVSEAWSTRGALWIYLDSSELKSSPHSIKEAIARELSTLGLAHDEIKCVVLDSLGSDTKDAWKILEKLILQLPDIPIIGMHTIEPGVVGGLHSDHPKLTKNFQSYYLWTLPRTHIRGMVTEYNGLRHVGDENSVITRIVSDLEMLNLHRTPLNCLTLLKVSELDFDESPVNRSEMIKRVLFLLFNAEELPTYKTRPDLKDCEFVLGFFCETLIRTGVYTFSRDHFLRSLQQCRRDQLIELEVHVVFDVLSANNILVSRGGQFAFKFAFWIFYFAAARMHQDQTFAEFVMSDMRYASYPELVEFYTGLDRRRDDALRILTRDLAQCRAEVDTKCGLPQGMDPYRLAQWTTSEAGLKQMRSEIEEGVRESNLPEQIKDSFADRGYDPQRPYDQKINVLGEFSLLRFMHTVRAASKALRNSDYVAPATKRLLLEEILRCWEQLTMVLIVVLPGLVNNGSAMFDGTNFILEGDFGATVQDRLNAVLTEIPANVVNWSKDDLLSQRMGPLLIDVFKNEGGDLRRHELMRLLVAQRPRGWGEAVQSYISSVPKNSFYLFDVYRALRTQYRFSYVSGPTLAEIEHLIRMAATKHVTGTKEPGPKLIEKMKPKFIGDPILPPREVP